MFFYEGMTCPVCQKEFSEQDDIVACPQCGAPHHRACWAAEGHCHFADRHGTEAQWSRQDTSDMPQQNSEKRCPHCGAPNPEFAEFCSHCARPLESEEWSEPSRREEAPADAPYREYPPFSMPRVDPYGGIPKTESVGGESAEDVAATVGQNTAYYLPRFVRMAHGGSKMAWNWAAFLFTPYWLLFRKNYLFGLLMMLFQMCSVFLNNLVFQQFYGTTVFSSNAEIIRYTQGLLSNPAAAPYLYLVAALLVVDLFLRLLFGAIGNYAYMNTVLGRIRYWKRKTPDTYKAQLPAAGGVSFLLAVLMYFLLQTVGLLF